MLDLKDGNVFVNYKDDGANGPCGQSVSITGPHDRIVIFKDMHAAGKFFNQLGKMKHRKNPRVENYWIYDEEAHLTQIFDRRDNVDV